MKMPFEEENKNIIKSDIENVLYQLLINISKTIYNDTSNNLDFSEKKEVDIEIYEKEKNQNKNEIEEIQSKLTNLYKSTLMKIFL